MLVAVRSRGGSTSANTASRVTEVIHTNWLLGCQVTSSSLWGCVCVQRDRNVAGLCTHLWRTRREQSHSSELLSQPEVQLCSGFLGAESPSPTLQCSQRRAPPLGKLYGNIHTLKTSPRTSFTFVTSMKGSFSSPVLAHCHNDSVVDHNRNKLNLISSRQSSVLCAPEPHLNQQWRWWCSRPRWPRTAATAAAPTCPWRSPRSNPEVCPDLEDTRRKFPQTDQHHYKSEPGPEVLPVVTVSVLGSLSSRPFTELTVTLYVLPGIILSSTASKTLPSTVTAVGLPVKEPEKNMLL